MPRSFFEPAVFICMAKKETKAELEALIASLKLTDPSAVKERKVQFFLALALYDVLCDNEKNTCVSDSSGNPEAWRIVCGRSCSE
jgi:hypothetical protein